MPSPIAGRVCLTYNSERVARPALRRLMSESGAPDAASARRGRATGGGKRQRGRDDPGGRAGRTAQYPLAAARETGRALRGQIPHHRLHALQLRQLRHLRTSPCSRSTARTPSMTTSASASRGTSTARTAASKCCSPILAARDRTGIAARRTRSITISGTSMPRQIEEVLILSGDHIYTMDYRPMLEFHRRKRAAVTVCVQPVPLEDASRFGLIVTDDEDRVDRLRGEAREPRSNLASMGVYVFDKKPARRYARSGRGDDRADDGRFRQGRHPAT